MADPAQIRAFLRSPAFGVVGASNNPEKYGNKVLKAYLHKGMIAYPVNPHEATIEGIASVASVDKLPASVESLSIITPPQVTDNVVEAAIAKGVKNIWMQPGAESPLAVKRCQDAGINVIADGSCILVELALRKQL